MKTSEEIKDIALAISKAQSEMTGAKKGAKNPFFKSNYSDLSMVIEALSEPFANNELCFVQAAEMNELKISVITRIIHSSGQWIESETQLPPTKNDAQGYGSAITYAKRYGLQSLAGVPSVDDDGNLAVTHKAEPISSHAAEFIRKAKESSTLEGLKQVYLDAKEGLSSHQLTFVNKSVNESKKRLENNYE